MSTVGTNQHPCIIDHCVAQGVPFAREYGGLLANRPLAAPRYPEPFTPGAKPANNFFSGLTAPFPAKWPRAKLPCFQGREMLDVVVMDGKARGIVARNLVTGEMDTHMGDAVVLCTGGIRQCLFPFHQCHGLQCHGGLPGLSQRALFSPTLALPRFTPPAFRCTAPINPS